MGQELRFTGKQKKETSLRKESEGDEISQWKNSAQNETA